MWSDRRLVAAVAVSVLLNVFLIGWVIGHGLSGERPRANAPGGGGGGRPVVHQNHVKLLSPDERHRFNAAMSGYRAAIRTARDTVRQRRQAVEEVLTAPNYDGAAAAAAFAALRAADAAVAEALHSGLVAAMGELPQPARAALVKRDDARVDAAAGAAGAGGGNGATPATGR